MIHRVALAAAMIALAIPQPAGAQASPAPAPTASAPDPALTARFAAFLTDMLAGKLPATGLSAKMQGAFTPELISQVDSNLAPLGAFQKLQFVSQDSVQGFQRYHYVGVFANGMQPLMFVLNSSNDIDGFFKDQSP